MQPHKTPNGATPPNTAECSQTKHQMELHHQTQQNAATQNTKWSYTTKTKLAIHITCILDYNPLSGLAQNFFEHVVFISKSNICRQMASRNQIHTRNYRGTFFILASLTEPLNKPNTAYFIIIMIKRNTNRSRPI